MTPQCPKWLENHPHHRHLFSSVQKKTQQMSIYCTPTHPNDDSLDFYFYTFIIHFSSCLTMKVQTDDEK